MDSAGAFLIDYKTIRIAVDPTVTSTWDFSRIDYVLLTGADSNSFTARKDIKIMAPASAVSELQQRGFTQVKGVSTGRRLYLKKDDVFLFAGPVTGGHGLNMNNGYLLEFDNGRNVYIGGRVSSIDPLREFVFSLRDDGKEIHLAVLRADTDALAAEAAALLQPQFIFYDPGPRHADRKSIDKILAEQLYSGVFAVLKRDQSVPF